MKKIWTFIAVTFGITWLVWGGLALFGMTLGSSVLSQIIVAVTMWAPALGVLLTKRIHREGNILHAGFRPKFRGHIRVYLFAWLIPALFTLLGAALYFLVFPGQFDPTLSAFAQSVPEGQSLTSPAVVGMLAVTLLTAPFFNTLFGLGEEIGWRGYLYPALAREMPRRRAILLSGLIWGLWHAPITIMGHNYGFDYWGYPFIGILAMCLFCTAMGILLSWMTERTGSIWPAGLAHGSLNAVAGIPLLFLSGNYASYQTLGPALPGMLAGAPLWIFAMVFWVRAYRE